MGKIGTKFGWMLLTLTLILCSCEQNQFGSVRAVIDKQEQEFKIQEVTCFNYANDGMDCVVILRNKLGIGDSLTFKISNVIDIHDTYLNDELAIFEAPMHSVEAIVNGNEVGVLSESSVNFSTISNRPGSQVCASFYLNFGFGTSGFMEGDFCGTVQ